MPAGYADYFKSIDGKQRTMIAESTGGPTWYTEYNVLTGLSARSFGDLKFYVTRITAGRVTRGLPQALQHCGYKTISLYPTYGDFLSARAFQKGTGVDQFIDMAEMGVNEDMQPDKFYFDQALKVFAREQPKQSPVFMFVYLTANHFPWHDVYRPDLTPAGWTPPGNTAEVDEYIRRQAMTANDYREFTERLKRDYPDESFLVLRFGDHQPAISQKLLEPGIDRATLAKRLMATDPRYYSTYYAIDGINYRRANLSSALETLDAAYIPLVLQEAAGLPLDPSFAEQKSIMLRCKGTFYACKKGAEARRFNRLLIDAGHDQGAVTLHVIARSRSVGKASLPAIHVSIPVIACDSSVAQGAKRRSNPCLSLRRDGLLRCARNDGRTSYFFPTFSHSHCATASGELVASLPAARRLASRIVAMSILPSSGASALRKPSSLARFGASSTIAS